MRTSACWHCPAVGVSCRRAHAKRRGRRELGSLLTWRMSGAQRGGHRVLIYSQMVKLLGILKYYCETRQYKHMVLSGETSHEDRMGMMQKWNAPASEYFIFMLSTRAGGQGINLQTADTVIIYDSDWNPMMDEQAKARVHRLGQKKQTLVLRLVTPHTVEEKVTKRAQARLQNEDLAIEAGKFNQRTDVAESHELLKQKLAQELQDQMERVKEQAHTDEQINELIARTPEEIDLFNAMDEEERAAQEKGGERPLPRLMVRGAGVKKGSPGWGGRPSTGGRRVAGGVGSSGRGQGCRGVRACAGRVLARVLRASPVCRFTV